MLTSCKQDPFAWKDDRGFHLLTHGRDDWWNTHYSFSVDGLHWSTGSDIATDPNITLTNGSMHVDHCTVVDDSSTVSRLFDTVILL